MKNFLRAIWRFLLCLYAPFLYGMDILEALIGDERMRYADGGGYNLDRSKTTFLMYWYKY